MTGSGAADGSARGRLGRATGLAALALAGAALAVLPHAVWWRLNGDVTYIADGDQLLYQAWSRGALRHGSAGLTDAVHPTPGPMMHPRALFVPTAWLGWALGLGPTGLSILWRAAGGAGVALGLYAAVRPALRDRRAALAVAAALLFDAGLIFGQPVLRPALVAASPARVYFGGVPRVMGHLRVVPPALALPPLLLMLGLVSRARATGSVRAAVGAGVALGLTFHLNLYFWTAAVGGLAVALVFDRHGRRGYALALAVGLAIGLPAVVSGARTKSATPPDWLLRTDKFVPIGHTAELLVPRVVLALLVVAAPWVALRRRDLAALWGTGVAGLAFANHQLITGLQVENFHWLIVAGTAVSLLIALAAAAPWAPRQVPSEDTPRRGAWPVLLLVVAVEIAAGCVLRVREATLTAETARWMAVVGGLRDDATPIPDGAVLAGDPDAVLVAAARGEAFALAGKLVEYCALVTDPEFDERLMLDLYLRGLARDAALRATAEPPGTLSWESHAVHSPEVAAAQRSRRESLVNRIWSDPAPFAARYGVTHVILPASTPSPAAALAAVGDARLTSAGRHWQLWEVRPVRGR